MEAYIEFSAKTKSEAITKACVDLGASSDELDIVVVSEGSSGFFGIGAKPAVIKARKKAVEAAVDEFKDIIGSVSFDSISKSGQKEQKKEPKKQQNKAPAKEKAAAPKEKKEVKKETPKEEPAEKKAAAENTVSEKKEAPKKPAKEKNNQEKAAKPQKTETEAPAEKEPKEQAPKQSKPIEILTDEEEIKDVEQRALVFLTGVFNAIGEEELGEVTITSVYNKEEGSLDVDFEGEDMGILIGKRGQTLDSLQYLTSLVVNKGKDKYIRVKLDTEDYRRRRKETLENLAKGIAYKVKKTHKPVVLEPMNPYERRIIHSALQGNKYVETISEGEEPYRHIVVRPKKGNY